MKDVLRPRSIIGEEMHWNSFVFTIFIMPCLPAVETHPEVICKGWE